MSILKVKLLCFLWADSRTSVRQAHRDSLKAKGEGTVSESYCAQRRQGPFSGLRAYLRVTVVITHRL